MNFKIIFVIILSTIFITTIFPNKTDGRQNPGFRKASQEIVFNDDLDFDSLKTSIERSISYYQKLPNREKILYPGRSFTKKEIISSFRRLIEICSIDNSSARIRALRGEFDILVPAYQQNKVLFTGYYEEFVRGSAERSGYFDSAVYSRPNDLVVVNLFPFNGMNTVISGKLIKDRLVPYDSREQISTNNSLEGRAFPICYVNKIDLFFMQIEGSGIIALADGTVIRVTYDSDNGRNYVPISSVIKNLNVTKADIIKHLKENKSEIDKILNTNPRYVFFKSNVAAPEGNFGEALVPGRSIAADPNFYPIGAVAYVSTSNGKSEKPVRRFACIHDSGSAIKGINRIDIYFGSSEQQRIDGEKFKCRGNLFLIVPKKPNSRPTYFARTAEKQSTELNID